MNLTLFDLDGTLIPFDSDHAFGEFMVRIGWTDRCYEYVAEGPMHVRVVSAASASVCAPGEEAGYSEPPVPALLREGLVLLVGVVVAGHAAE